MLLQQQLDIVESEIDSVIRLPLYVEDIMSIAKQIATLNVFILKKVYAVLSAIFETRKCKTAKIAILLTHIEQNKTTKCLTSGSYSQ